MSPEEIHALAMNTYDSLKGDGEREISREEFMVAWEATKQRLSPYMRKLAEARIETERFIGRCSCPDTCFFHTRLR